MKIIKEDELLESLKAGRVSKQDFHKSATLIQIREEISSEEKHLDALKAYTEAINRLIKTIDEKLLPNPQNPHGEEYNQILNSLSDVSRRQNELIVTLNSLVTEMKKKPILHWKFEFSRDQDGLIKNIIAGIV